MKQRDTVSAYGFHLMGDLNQDAMTTSNSNPLRVTSPASEFTFGWGDARQTIWARAGNDYLSAFNPTTAGDGQTHIDRFLGDAEETLSGSSTRLFSDVFILGDYNIPYYVDAKGARLQYAVVTDFDPVSDRIRLYGDASNYQLVQSSDSRYTLSWMAPSSGRLDLIANITVIDVGGFDPTTDVLDLSEPYFEFIGDEAPVAVNENVYQFGTTSRDIPNGIVVDADGDVIVVGSTSGDLDGDGASTYEGIADAWVAKYDPDGNLLWFDQFGSEGYDSASNVTVDGDGNVYVTGQTTGYLGEEPGGVNQGARDYWLAKYDTDGNQIWIEQATETNDFDSFVIDPRDGTEVEVPATVQDELFDVSFGVETDSEGNIYQGGLVDRGVSLDAIVISGQIIETPGEDPQPVSLRAEDDFFLNKYDSDGNLTWRREYGNLGLFDEQYDIAVDDDADFIYATGWTYGDLGSIDGETDEFLGFYDVWLAQFDAENGDLIWLEQFGSDEFEFSWGVEVDSQGNAYAVGWTYGDITDNDKTVLGNTEADIWISKFNNEGTQLWTQQFGTPGDDVALIGAFQIGPDDGLYLAGYTDNDLGGENEGETDIWVAKYDDNGNEQWVQQIGTQQADFAFDVDSDGTFVYVTGFTEGSLGAENVGSTDGVIIKLDASTGEILNFGDSPEPTPFVNEIEGTAGNDRLLGSVNNDKILGLAGRDTLIGDFNDDLLDGGEGNDRMSGGAGSDGFIFSGDNIGSDRITDFVTGEDQILLSKATFAAIGGEIGEALAEGDFAVVGSRREVKRSEAEIVYDTSRGNLFYNPNGVDFGFGEGGGKFATLTNTPLDLTAADFTLIA
ncbi:MAG: SBBP repeat-containing protein [Cyanobacteria bacterium J06639_1]